MSIKPPLSVLVTAEFDIIEPAAPDEPMDDEQSAPEVVMPTQANGPPCRRVQGDDRQGPATSRRAQSRQRPRTPLANIRSP
jgi:hypothetical protein